MTLLRAGFIGLGNIGKPLASHLVPTGFETTLYDIAEEPVRELEKAGAKAARSPRELAENAGRAHRASPGGQVRQDSDAHDLPPGAEPADVAWAGGRGFK